MGWGGMGWDGMGWDGHHLMASLPGPCLDPAWTLPGPTAPAGAARPASPAKLESNLRAAAAGRVARNQRPRRALEAAQGRGL